MEPALLAVIALICVRAKEVTLSLQARINFFLSTDNCTPDEHLGPKPVVKHAEAHNERLPAQGWLVSFRGGTDQSRKAMH